MSARPRSPSGGSTIGGRGFSGGQFVPFSAVGGEDLFELQCGRITGIDAIKNAINRETEEAFVSGTNSAANQYSTTLPSESGTLQRGFLAAMSELAEINRFDRSITDSEYFSAIETESPDYMKYWVGNLKTFVELEAIMKGTMEISFRNRAIVAGLEVS